MKISISAAKKFYYGMRIRGFSIGTQPKGHTEFIQPEEVPKDIEDRHEERAYKFGIVVYPFPLSKRDIEHYSLTDLNAPNQDEQWQEFIALVKKVKEAGIDFEEFKEEVLKRTGHSYHMNPFREDKPIVLFKVLGKKGYAGNIKGLEKFFQKT